MSEGLDDFPLFITDLRWPLLSAADGCVEAFPAAGALLTLLRAAAAAGGESGAFCDQPAYMEETEPAVGRAGVEAGVCIISRSASRCASSIMALTSDPGEETVGDDADSAGPGGSTAAMLGDLAAALSALSAAAAAACSSASAAAASVASASSSSTARLA